MVTPFQRTIDELETHAVKWWPKALTSEQAASSVIPTLIRTLDDFLSILKLSKDRPDQVFDLLKASSLPPNVFLKHLCVLADFGGEPLMRVNKDMNTLFPRKSGRLTFEFFWRTTQYEYEFKSLPVSGLNNSRLHIDGASLASSWPLDASSIDVAMLLLHGASSVDETLASETFRKCDLGSLLGRDEELEKYVREKYILVSRITGGAEANTLGQIAQTYVKSALARLLGPKYSLSATTITLSTGEIEVFDIVVSNGSNCKIGIEVSFQVTTNSTIERKAKQAELRHGKLNRDGHRIAYVVDGAGNFMRRKAIGMICDNSDCTVAYSDEEIRVLSDFIKSVYSL